MDSDTIRGQFPDASFLDGLTLDGQPDERGSVVQLRARLADLEKDRAADAAMLDDPTYVARRLVRLLAGYPDLSSLARYIVMTLESAMR